MNQPRTLCVMGTFDSQTNMQVKALKGVLAAQGILTDAYEPHITFGIYTGLDNNSLLQWVCHIAKSQYPFQICFNHFGFFAETRLCFLAPGANQNLLTLHARIHENFDERCVDKGCLYSVKHSSWVPHLTIATIQPGEEKKLFDTIGVSFIPFTAEITQLKVTSSDTSKELAVFELKS